MQQIHVCCCFGLHCSVPAARCSYVRYEITVSWTLRAGYTCGAEVSVRDFQSILDQTSCSFLSKPGSWSPRRLVMVAFYMFFFSQVYSLLVSAQVLSARWQHVQCDEGFPSSSTLLHPRSSSFVPMSLLKRLFFNLIYIAFIATHIIVTLLPAPDMKPKGQGPCHHSTGFVCTEVR